MAENQNNNSRAMVPSGPGIIGPGLVYVTDSRTYKQNSPVAVGGTRVYPIYVGGSEVSQIYIGSKQIYGMKYETRSYKFSASDMYEYEGSGSIKVYTKTLGFNLNSNCKPVYIYASSSDFRSISIVSKENSYQVSVVVKSTFTDVDMAVTLRCYYVVK